MSKTNFVAVDLTFDPPQADYLQNIAERDDMDFSEALRKTISRKLSQSQELREVLQKSGRKHVVISKSHLKVIDFIAAKNGITRSEAARRLVDEERSQSTAKAPC